MPNPTNKPGKVYLVGAGPGDRGLLTLRGKACLELADVVLYDRLLDPRLLDYAAPTAELIYAGKEARRHALSQHEINELLVEKASAGRQVVRLKGGDPFVFGRGGEELERLHAAGIPFEVVPGVTAAIAAAAYAGIPVTHRGLASSFAVITGHEDPAKPESSIDWARLATATDTLVFLMGVENLPSIVEQLIRHGRPPRTPVALVRWGSWPQQETLAGTLEDIVARLERREFGPPAVIVVGETVALREQLRWFETRPLFGKRVLVTRSREQASQLAATLEELGAQVLEAPAIEIAEPEDFGPLDSALQQLGGYDWVVFTSANGVEAVFRRLRTLSLDSRAFGGTRLAAVGLATAAALQRYGLHADLVPEQFLTKAVAEALAQAGVAGARVLLPRTQLVGEDLGAALAAQRAQVDQVVAYRTLQASSLSPEVVDLLRRGEIDIVTFASSSTVTNLLALLGDSALELLSRSTIACIGPVTSRTADAAGLPVHIEAEEYTVPGLVQAIQTHAQSQMVTSR